MSTEEDTVGLDALPSEEITSALHDISRSELQTDDYDLKLESGSKKGDNYIGVVYRVTATAKDKVNGDKPRELSLIVKLPPQNAARRAQFMARPAFVREIQVYDEILPLLHEFQLSRGIIPEENGFADYAKCYKTIDTEPTEALFFQDLKAVGFEMFDRHKNITFAHTSLVMNALGRYHALWFALRDQQPEVLEKYSKLVDLFTEKKDDPAFTDYFNLLIANVQGSLKDPKDAQLLEKINRIYEKQPMAIVDECVQGPPAEPYAVVCHGDCWNNNILFKYDENNAPVELRLLDFQIARYASPVLDLLYYVFCCTTKELRDEHYEDLLKIYHSSLSDFLKRLGSDPEKLFPFEALQGQLKKFGKFGLVMATMLLPILTSAGEDCPDLDDLAETIERGENIATDVFKMPQDIYNKRMRDVCFDIDRLGYI